MKWLIACAALVALLAPVQAGHVDVDAIRWACGPGGSGATGHPERCGIDPIGGSGVESMGEPLFGPPWTEPGDLMLGVVVNGDARAYPVQMLDRHEIVNDVIGGIPVAVTYCPLCGSGVSFERTVDLGAGKQVLSFEASGFLYANDLVMWDAQSETLWTQILGRPIGTLDAEQVVPEHPDVPLRVVPTQLVTWGEWREAHPDSGMLQPVTGMRYGGAYAGYADNCAVGISGGAQCDVRGLHPKELVVGVRDGNVSAAFPMAGLRAVGVAQFEHDGLRILVHYDGGVVHAYDARHHEFARAGSEWVDQDGHVWDLAGGQRVDGVDALRSIDHLTSYWFAWDEHHPGAGLWAAPEEALRSREDNGQLTGFMIPVVASILLVGAYFIRRRA